MNGDVLVAVLTVFLVVNVVLVVRAWAKGQLARPRALAGTQTVATRADVGVAVAPASPEPRLSASPDPSPGLDPAPPDPAPATIALLLSASPDPADVQPPPTAPDPLSGSPGPAGRDTIPGLGDRATWDRRVADENARALRYRRPVTIVRIELDGFDRLVEIRGDEAGDRLLRATADTLRRLARDTDHVAYLEGGRFGILMPETSDEAAATYVDRVARASELWLESGAVAVRLAIGWAATSGQTDLAVVEQLASGRVRPAPWPVTRPEDSPPGRARAGVATDSPPAMDLSWVAVQARSWETCNDPHCNHKEDHRRDRAAR